MARAKRTDGNQTEIVNTFRTLGARVNVTSDVGNGFPDLVIQYIFPNRKSHHLETLLVEVKMPGEGLTPDQEIFHSVFVVYIVETVRDVFNLLEINYQD